MVYQLFMTHFGKSHEDFTIATESKLASLSMHFAQSEE